jgi:hypothetical protein
MARLAKVVLVDGNFYNFFIFEFSRLFGLQALLGNGGIPPYILTMRAAVSIFGSHLI